MQNLKNPRFVISAVLTVIYIAGFIIFFKVVSIPSPTGANVTPTATQSVDTDNNYDIVVPTPTISIEEITPTPTNTSITTDNVTVIGEINISYLQQPEKVQSFDLLDPMVDSSTNKTIDYNQNATTYKVGRIDSLTTQFLINGVEQTKDFKGYDYYIADYSNYEGIFYILYSNSEKIFYIIDGGQINGTSKKVIEMFIDINQYSAFNPLYRISTSDNSDSQGLTSDKGVDYSSYYFSLVQPSSLTSMAQVDSYFGAPIYKGKQDGKWILFVKTPDGFIDILSYYGSFADTNGIAKFTFNNGTRNTDLYYDGSTEGTCADQFTDFADIDTSTQAIIGKDFNNNPISGPKNKSDSYLNIEYQKYINDYTPMIEDITPTPAPMTLDQYYNNYSIIYWRNEYGMLIRYHKDGSYPMMDCGKPAVYLYPTKTTDLSVKLTINGTLRFTLPKYSNGWDVKASPDGTIYNYGDGKKYDYLWWESDATGKQIKMTNGGIILPKDEMSTKLKNVLTSFGLNQKETNQFLEYWLPILNSEKSQYIYFTFLYNDEVNQIGKLDFSVTPDTEMRIFMLYKPVTANYETKKLYIPTMTRKGFTVVEWGGGKY